MQEFPPMEEMRRVVSQVFRPATADAARHGGRGPVDETWGTQRRYIS